MFDPVFEAIDRHLEQCDEWIVNEPRYATAPRGAYISSDQCTRSASVRTVRFGGMLPKNAPEREEGAVEGRLTTSRPINHQQPVKRSQGDLKRVFSEMRRLQDLDTIIHRTPTQE